MKARFRIMTSICGKSSAGNICATNHFLSSCNSSYYNCFWREEFSFYSAFERERAVLSFLPTFLLWCLILTVNLTHLRGDHTCSVASIRSAGAHVCEAFFKFLIDEGGASLLQAVSSWASVLGGCVRMVDEQQPGKAKTETALLHDLTSGPASWFLLWVPALTSFSDVYDLGVVRSQ